MTCCARIKRQLYVQRVVAERNRVFLVMSQGTLIISSFGEDLLAVEALYNSLCDTFFRATHQFMPDSAVE